MERERERDINVVSVKQERGPNRQRREDLIVQLFLDMIASYRNTDFWDKMRRRKQMSVCKLFLVKWVPTHRTTNLPLICICITWVLIWIWPKRKSPVKPSIHRVLHSISEKKNKKGKKIVLKYRFQHLVQPIVKKKKKRPCLRLLHGRTKCSKHGMWRLLPTEQTIPRPPSKGIRFLSTSNWKESPPN